MSKMTDMELQMIRALTKIDDELGMPQDGCNSTEKTITAIRLLNAIHKDDQKYIATLEEKLSAQPVPEITKESIRACGGIVHADGNVFFTGIRQIKAMLEAAKP